MTIRIAVIGAGVMGTDHARIVARDLPGATLQVVCDADATRARAVADETGAADIATDPEAVIARGDVDAVLLASPDHTHAPLSIACIEAGKPVLCEKPMAPTAGECLDVIAAEVKAGRRLLEVGFMRRFDPSYVEMKAALDSGRLGAPLMMHNFHRNVEVPDWFTGSMAITNSAPHEFDVVRHVLGDDFAEISAFEPAPVEDRGVGPVVMVLRTVGGRLVTIEVNNNARYGYDVRGEVVGTEGSVTLGTPVHSRLNAGLQSVETYAADWRPRFAEAYRLQNRDWVDSIRAGVPSAIAASAWDGYLATCVAEAGARALAEGRTVALEVAERPALYA